MCSMPTHALAASGVRVGHRFAGRVPRSLERIFIFFQRKEEKRALLLSREWVQNHVDQESANTAAHVT